MNSSRNLSMKTRFVATHTGAILILMFLGATLVNSAPPDSKPKIESAAADSNAVPQSTFNIPSNFSQGRDPFYPNARYMLGEIHVVAQVRVTAGIDLIHLNGISGSADHKLAMINFRTMAEGETNDFLTVSGHVKVRCVEIKSQSVVIEVIGGERRELRLRE